MSAVATDRVACPVCGDQVNLRNDGCLRRHGPGKQCPGGGQTPKPPVQCGNCGAAIQFAPGQLVGDPEAIARVADLQRERDEALKVTRSEIPILEQLQRKAKRVTELEAALRFYADRDNWQMPAALAPAIRDRGARARGVLGAGETTR